MNCGNAKDIQVNRLIQWSNPHFAKVVSQRSKGKNQLSPSLCNQVLGRPVIKSFGVSFIP